MGYSKPHSAAVVNTHARRPFSSEHPLRHSPSWRSPEAQVRVP